MRYTQFDFDDSSYVNSRNTTKSNITRSAKQANILKSYMPRIDSAPIVGDFRGVSFDTALKFTDIPKDWLVPALIDGIEYHRPVDATHTHLVSEAPLTLPFFGPAELGNSSSDAPNKYIGEVNLYDLVRGKQFADQASTYFQMDGTRMPIITARDTLIALKSEVDVNLTTSHVGFVYGEPINASRYGVDSWAYNNKKHISRSIVTSLANTSTIYTHGKCPYTAGGHGADIEMLTPTDSIVNRGYVILGFDISKSTTVSDVGWSLAESVTVYRGITTTYVDSYLLPTDANPTKFSCEFTDLQEVEYSRYEVLRNLVDKLDATAKNALISNGYTIKIPGELLSQLLQVEIDNIATIISQGDVMVQDAANAELVEEMVAQFGATDSILNLDISNMDEMYTSYKISLQDGLTSYEDEDKRTPSGAFVEADQEFPDWKDYFYVLFDVQYVLDPSTYSTYQLVSTVYTAKAYLPNWEKLKQLNPYKFMLLMQICFTIDVGTPKPKKDIIGSLILLGVSILQAIYTQQWQAAALAWAAVAGQAIAIIGVVTNNQNLVRVGGYIALIAAVLSIAAATSGLNANKKLTPLEYAAGIANQSVKALNSVFNEVAKFQQAKWVQQINELKDDVDGANELVSAQSKETKIKELIYGDVALKHDKFGYDAVFITPYDRYLRFS